MVERILKFDKIDALLSDNKQKKIIFAIIISQSDFDRDVNMLEYINKKIKFYYKFIWNGHLLNQFPNYINKKIDFVFYPDEFFSKYVEEKIENIKFTANVSDGDEEFCLDERISNINYVIDYKYVA